MYDNSVKIVWDEPKRLINLDKHGMDFASLTVEFFEAATIYPTKGYRLFALGKIDGEFLTTVIFAPLGTEAVSVISMRPASPKERKLV